MALWIKICGLTSVGDALAAIDAGADAIGVNLVPSSKRRVDIELAGRIREAVGERAEVVAVVADLVSAELVRVRAEAGIEWLQLHGHEAPEALAPLLPKAYKAVPIATSADVGLARSYAGERLLTDTKVSGALGGTGQSFDWSLVAELARERRLILAGGLTPDNVRRAVETLRPFGVDVASGVEGDDPRRKDVGRMQRFVREAREGSR